MGIAAVEAAWVLDGTLEAVGIAVAGAAWVPDGTLEAVGSAVAVPVGFGETMVGVALLHAAISRQRVVVASNQRIMSGGPNR